MFLRIYVSNFVSFEFVSDCYSPLVPKGFLSKACTPLFLRDFLVEGAHTAQAREAGIART